MVYPVPSGKSLREMWGETDSRKRDWQFRGLRLHEQLLDRVEGMGAAHDYDEFDAMPSSAQAPPGAPFAATDFHGVEVKNRYNAKSYPWLEAYGPAPRQWNVTPSKAAPTTATSRGTAARFKNEFSSPPPSSEPCPCAVSPQQPSAPVMHYSQQPCACTLAGQTGACQAAQTQWQQQHEQPTPPTRQNWPTPLYPPQQPPRGFAPISRAPTMTPFSGWGNVNANWGAPGAPGGPAGTGCVVSFVVPAWGLWVITAFSLLLLGFAVYGVVTLLIDSVRRQ